MRYRLLAVASIVGLLFAAGSYAADDNSARPAVETSSTEKGRAMTAGLVKKVDKSAGKVTIRHEPIESLGMPKMTMVYRVKDPAMLDRLKPGDKINFIADKANGAYTLMSFEPAE